MTMRTRSRSGASFVKLLGLVIAIAGGLILSSATAAASNRGDIWLNNVGSSADPGHVPHLQYKDIAMYANYPGGSGGTFQIVAWKPTGDNQSVVYVGTWSYDPNGAAIQQIATVSTDTLYANVQQLGFTPQQQQGYHFKMFCSIGKHDKMKEFWVAAPTGPPTPTPSPSTTPTTNPTPTATPTGGVAGASGSKIGLAATGGPLLGAGLLLIVLGGFTWIASTVLRRRI